jgi:hypothetical protein
MIDVVGQVIERFVNAQENVAWYRARGQAQGSEAVEVRAPGYRTRGEYPIFPIFIDYPTKTFTLGALAKRRTPRKQT